MFIRLSDMICISFSLNMIYIDIFHIDSSTHTELEMGRSRCPSSVAWIGLVQVAVVFAMLCLVSRSAIWRSNERAYKSSQQADEESRP